MKCLNMKIIYILFFMANLIEINSRRLPQDKNIPITKPLVDEDILKSNFDKDCPHLSQIIREKNLTSYTVNSKLLSPKSVKVNEENVLEYACFIVKNILTFMCKNNLNMAFNLTTQENVSSICPFDFSHLEKLGFTLFNNNGLINELTRSDHCTEVCRDLYSTKTQCVVLSQFNNYLKLFSPNQGNSTTVEIGEPSVMSEPSKVSTQKTENGIVNILQNEEQVSKKNDLKKNIKEEYIETTDAKSTISINDAFKPIHEERKTEKPWSSTPREGKSSKKLEMPESNIKMSRDENFIPENNELKLKNEDLNEDDELNNDDDLSSIGSMGETFPVKTDSAQIQKLPKLETSEVRIDSSSKGKEIYSGEGFFQAEDSHFFFYFIMVSSIIVVGYLAFHNKNKILAYALEGTNARRSRRRPNPARYRKLETNLEEVISSSSTNASSNVVY